VPPNFDEHIGLRSSVFSVPSVVYALTAMDRNPPPPSNKKPLRMFLVPCSCGTTFSVAENYDRSGTSWNRYLTCPNCGKRHDPKNRLLELGFQPGGYWKVDRC
jgi:hypothetical protein